MEGKQPTGVLPNQNTPRLSLHTHTHTTVTGIPNTKNDFFSDLDFYTHTHSFTLTPTRI